MSKRFYVEYFGIDANEDEHELEGRHFKIQFRHPQECELVHKRDSQGNPLFTKAGKPKYRRLVPDEQIFKDAIAWADLTMKTEICDRYPNYPEIQAHLFQGKGQGTRKAYFSTKKHPNSMQMAINLEAQRKGQDYLTPEQQEALLRSGNNTIIKKF